MLKYALLITICFLLVATACKEAQSPQDLVNRAIEVSGGEGYTTNSFEFTFREKEYRLTRENGRRILWRHTMTDSGVIVDKKTDTGFERYFSNERLVIPDSMARKYGNSVNSVHYFAYLPYGLNDAAVIKRNLGERTVNGQSYQKVEITFREAGGGEDYEDVFVYWFNNATGKPDYLAYTYHTDGGGSRFRVAFNERYVNGIRFVDYKNYKPKEKGVPASQMDSLYEAGALELLSEIKLEEIRVIPDSYN